MGFFSWECNGCGHPALSTYAINATNAWMRNVVVLRGDDTVLMGEYDGYGRVYTADCDPEADEEGVSVMLYGEGDREWEDRKEPALWHEACFNLADGKIPTVWTPELASKDADDQGYFFGPEDHAMPEPKTAADVAAGRRFARMVAQARADEWRA